MEDQSILLNQKQLVLLTGSSGYIGGRLLRALEAAGWPLRCLSRRPEFLRPRVGKTTQIVEGDIREPRSLLAALHDVHTAYYLMQPTTSSEPSEQEERWAATGFAEAARTAGVRRIIYLGGLASHRQPLDPLARILDVGSILRSSGVPTIEFLASIIIGSGSLSFEMIRALVDRLPVMLIPQWVCSKTRSIAIEDVIAYLLAALEVPEETSGEYEIGRPEATSYREIMKEYARQKGLKRAMLPVPVLAPRLSSAWIGLITPIYPRVSRKLIDTLQRGTATRGTQASEVFQVKPRGFREAIARALKNEDQDFAQTRWSDALSSRGTIPSWGGVRFGSRLIDSRSAHVPYSPAEVFRPVQRIGGPTGWYYANWLWQLRGFIDLLQGGAGMRRGRRHPELLAVGETVDFWRVEAIEPNRFLRLSAEMNLHGRAWLQFEIEPDGSGSIIRQTAIFDPLGIRGLLYWYSIYPFHGLIFNGMLRGIGKAAQTQGS
ncbi:MAG: SDR family oxidoreductase [Acidobacteria bacterium]|nr:SDR family oxidoreductase [Acidobacteriota bacterium]